MTHGVSIRDATPADAGACAAIYAPYVTGSSITFEEEAPDADAMAARISAARATHAWLVLESGAQVVGYAYAHAFAERAAYRWACETSIYLTPGARRAGSGRRLYSALLDRLAARGYRIAMAGMTLPNEASAGLHRALGFEPAGVHRRIGYKHGAWHDVAWVRKALGDGADPPAEPR